MLGRRVLAAAVSLMAAAGGVLVAGAAQAQPVATGSFRFSGDRGDYVSQGRSYAYDTSKGDQVYVTSSDGGTVQINVRAANGDWWYLNFDAPGTPGRPVPGQPAVLAPGTYTVKKLYPSNGNGPGLSLEGNGRGAGGYGSFTIINAVFGANGYVQTFDATFEQYGPPVYGVTGHPAARGEVHISNPPGSYPPRSAEPGPSLQTAVATGSFSISGYLRLSNSGAAQSFSYSTSKGDALDVQTTTGTTVQFSVNAYNGDEWSVIFDAPGSKVLTPGTYTGVAMYPFNGNSPGLMLTDTSELRQSCNGVNVSFTVTRAVFGRPDYVQAFDATFEQQCKGRAVPTRGEVHISNPPPPPQAAASTRPRISTNSTTPRPGQGGSRSAADPVRTTLLVTSAGAITWVVLVVAGFAAGLMAGRRRRTAKTTQPWPGGSRPR